MKPAVETSPWIHRFHMALVILLGLGMANGAAARSPVVPLPAAETSESGAFTVTATTPVTVAPNDTAAAAAAGYFVDLAAGSGAVPVKSGHGQGGIAFVTDRRIGNGRADSYRLKITPTGITISAATPSGLFYGGITLWQLLTERPGSQAVTLAARTIDDTPRFSWRGLMLDSARHYQSPSYIEHFIDWMALHKLNVLHWHLTDDQAWRIEIRHYPKLTEIGGWRVPAGQAAALDIDPATGQPRKIGGIYTQDQIRALVAYAALRHITIVPEIDIPGHATAAIAAYPALGVAPVTVTVPSSDWGVLNNLFNVDENTFTFVETVLGEVMELFPSPYIHVGGDEAVKDQWKASASVQARMKELGVANEEALQNYFTDRIGVFLTQHGRRLIGWDEILQGGAIAPSAAVMSWRGIAGAVAAAKADHDAVLAPWPLLYLDNRQGPSTAEPPGRGAIVTVKDVYHFDPMPAGLPRDKRSHILGVQANLWTEHMRTEEQVTRMAYPRAAALAEIAWSPVDSKNWSNFSERLRVQEQRYHRIGLADDDVMATPTLPPPAARRYSQDLKLCTNKLPISLEDDAPITGPRAIFLIDIMNPCWIYPHAKLPPNSHLTVSVGQVPFNFQIGKDRDSIHLLPPHTPYGELDVRADDCTGAPIAVLPLPDPRENTALSTLSAALPTLSGHHDLCFRFTGASLDPLWAINWIQLNALSEPHR